MKYLPRALGYLRPHWKLATISGLFTVVQSLLSQLGPWPMALFVGFLGDKPLPPFLANILGSIGQDRTSLLLLAVLGGLGLVLVQNTLAVFDSYVNTKITQHMVMDFRSDLFAHVQRLSLAYHDQRRAGMIIYTINSQGDAPARVVMIIPSIIQSILTLVGFVWILFALDWQLALIALGVVPFLYYSVGFYARYIEPRLYQVRTVEGTVLAIIHETISMLRVIVAFGRERHEHQRFRDQAQRAVDARLGITVRQTVFSLAVNTITALGLAALMGFGGWKVMNGQISGVVLMAVIGYVGHVYKPLESMSTTFGSMQEVLVALKQAFEVLDHESDIKDAPDAVSIKRTRGAISFDRVSFNYTGRVATLVDVSLEAEPGQVIAVVGPTGAGKTTLVSLIPRFYEAQNGCIRLDGQDIRKLTLESLRNQISIVLQEPLLFSGTIAENIRYGRLDASMESIIEAARAANAHDFITHLPKQYDTDLGERGVQVSGGERQRIAVARAFLRNAPILILDEPTSSIDSKTEAIILDALDRLMAGRTTFIIAHRLSTIRRADKIIVLNHGRLVEQGTHDELLQVNGLYRQLHDLQTRASKIHQEEMAYLGDGTEGP